MDYTITIPNELIPGIVAIAFAEGNDPEDVVQAYAISAANKACQDLKVGPYYTGPTPPQFNKDGSPYVAPAGDAVTEPAVETNDSSVPVEGV